jgi:hypothetical protein
MSADKAVVAVSSLCFGLGFAAGLFVVLNPNSERLDACAQQNNVHECELVAQPKEQSK